MRRRSKPKRIYTLSRLLERQPKTLRKHPYYTSMYTQYVHSITLQQLRISRRCYSLLNRATVDPQNLKYFYRTYRLPKDPFFPLFFLIKRDYLQGLEKRRKEKKEYIASKMCSLPEQVLEYIKFLARYEQGLHPRALYPVWSQNIFPATKKRVNEYSSFTLLEWVSVFHDYFLSLEKRYTSHTPVMSHRILACFILQCLPEENRFCRPHMKTVNSQYRRLCKQYHPDSGGDSDYFLQLKWAKDILSE